MNAGGRRARCGQCGALVSREYLNSDGLCECCQVQPEIDLGIPQWPANHEEAA